MVILLEDILHWKESTGSTKNAIKHPWNVDRWNLRPYLYLLAIILCCKLCKSPAIINWSLHCASIALNWCFKQTDISQLCPALHCSIPSTVLSCKAVNWTVLPLPSPAALGESWSDKRREEEGGARAKIRSYAKFRLGSAGPTHTTGTVFH